MDMATSLISTPSKAELLAWAAEYLDALAERDAARFGDTSQVLHAENNVAIPFGEGAWRTADRIETTLQFADPAARSTTVWGLITEAESTSPFALRTVVDADGKLLESELFVIRRQDIAAWGFLEADYVPGADFEAGGTVGCDRAGLIEHADSYFRTLERNDGTVHVRLHSTCVRRENGVLTADNPDRAVGPPMWEFSAHDQFAAGYYGANDRVRDRRYHVVDEEAGVVLGTAYIDHSGSRALLEHKDGSTKPSRYRRPHSLYVFELFLIRNNEIVLAEAIHMGVPYWMKPALPQR
jgi:hypothetical protein